MGFDTNNSIPSEPENTLYDHVYEAYDAVSKKTGEIKGAASSQAKKLYSKADELKNRYLNAEYLTTKAKQTIHAKLLPLSTPKDLQKQMKKTTKEITFLSKVQSERESKLITINKRIEALAEEIEKNKSNPAKKKNLENSLKFQKELQTNCAKQIKAAKKSIKSDQDILNYLELKKQSMIRGRFTGWAGWISNIAIPGSGRLVGVGLTAANLLSQQNSVNILPEQMNVRANEQKNVNIGTMLTVATTVSSIAFSVFAMPILKEAALTTWRTWYPFSPI